LPPVRRIEGVVFPRAEWQPHTLDTEVTETQPEGTEDLEAFAGKSCLGALCLDLCALGDKVWD
jgi:hypothetical protein